MSISSPRAPATARQRGFNLIELIIFILVMTIAVAGVLRIITLTTANSADPQLRKQALAIAASLLEEIELARFTYCDPGDPNPSPPLPTQCSSGYTELIGPEATNTSRMYDNVNDYGSLTGPVTYTTDAAGNAFPAGYTAKVTITAETALGPPTSPIISSTSPTTMNALRISVAVSYNGGDAVVLDGVRTRYQPTWMP